MVYLTVEPSQANIGQQVLVKGQAPQAGSVELWFKHSLTAQYGWVQQWFLYTDSSGNFSQTITFACDSQSSCSVDFGARMAGGSPGRYPNDFFATTTLNLSAPPPPPPPPIPPAPGVKCHVFAPNPRVFDQACRVLICGRDAYTMGTDSDNWVRAYNVPLEGDTTETCESTRWASGQGLTPHFGGDQAWGAILKGPCGIPPVNIEMRIDDAMRGTIQIIIKKPDGSVVGTYSGTGTYKVPLGGGIVIQAIPNSGWKFDHWSAGWTTDTSIVNPLEIGSINTDGWIQANFVGQIQLGFEIWNQTTGADAVVDAQNVQSADKSVSASVGDKILIKGTGSAGEIVDLYIGEFGNPATLYVDTRTINSSGYFQFENFQSGLDATRAGTQNRYFIHFRGANKDSDGIRLIVTPLGPSTTVTISGVTWNYLTTGSKKIVISIPGGQGGGTCAVPSIGGYVFPATVNNDSLYIITSTVESCYGDIDTWVKDAIVWCRNRGYEQVHIAGFSAGADIASFYACGREASSYPVDSIMLAGLMDVGFTSDFKQSWLQMQTPVFVAKGQDVPGVPDVGDQFYNATPASPKIYKSYASPHSFLGAASVNDFLDWVKNFTVIGPHVPTIMVTPTTVIRGQNITFTGGGFTHNGKVDVCIAGLCAMSAGTADSSGNINIQMSVGDNIPTGSQDAWAHDVSSNRDSNSVTITVQSGGGGAPIVSVSPKTVKLNDTVTVNLSNLVSGTVYTNTLRWSGNAISLGNLTATGSTASFQFSVGANLPAGVITLRCEIKSNNTVYGEDTFTVGTVTHIFPYESAHFRWTGDEQTISGDLSLFPQYFFPYMEAVYAKYAVYFAHEPTQYLKIDTTINPSSQCSGGLGGGTGGGDLTFCAGTWGYNKYCLWLLGHELANLWTGSITGGWPWADGSNLWKGASPFPLFASVKAMEDSGSSSWAQEWWSSFSSADSINNGNNRALMFKELQSTYGWDIYKRAFARMKELSENLDSYSEPMKTHVVFAYLKYGANGADLIPLFTRYGFQIDEGMLNEEYTRISGIQTFNITIQVQGQGTTNPVPGVHQYNMGEFFTLSAVPATGWKFDHWESFGMVSIENPVQAGPVNTDGTITAVFTEIPPPPPNTANLTISVEVGECGTTDPAPGTYTYNIGDLVTLTANALIGGDCVFDHWEGSGYLMTSNNPISITIEGDTWVKAVFRHTGIPPEPKIGLVAIVGAAIIAGAIALTLGTSKERKRTKSPKEGV